MKPWELIASWRDPMAHPKADTYVCKDRTWAQMAICSRPLRRQQIEGTVSHDRTDHRVILEDGTDPMEWHDRLMQFFGAAPLHKKITSLERHCSTRRSRTTVWSICQSCEEPGWRRPHGPPPPYVTRCLEASSCCPKALLIGAGAERWCSTILQSTPSAYSILRMSTI